MREVEEQRRAVRSGCASCAAGLALVAGLILLAAAPGPLLRRLSFPGAGADVAVFVRFDQVGHEVFWGGAFTLVALLAAGAARRTTVAAVAGLAVIAISSSLGALAWYVPCAALRVAPAEIGLLYLWPRPSVRIASSELLGADLEETLDGADPIFRLNVRTLRGAYGTMWTSSRPAMLALEQRIDAVSSGAR
jgi:hypothetical protein